MYVDTLGYYERALGCDYPIVFCENSDADLTDIQSNFKGALDLEIVQFSPLKEPDCSGFDNSRGKGYNEFLMIKKALGKSARLRECSHLLKITGRYPMLNIKAMIAEMEKRMQDKDVVYMGDIKDTCVYEMLGIKTMSSHFGDSRFFCVQTENYRQNMCDCFMEMNDNILGQWAEDYFLRLSRQFRHDPRFIFRYRHQVQFGGVSGAVKSVGCAKGNYDYNSLRNRIKNKIRYMLRLLFPNVWF